jgi:ribulose-phosphate 3-epimerase
MSVQIAPSILSADFARLADGAAAVAGVADWLHVDVMDNHFVPNLTIGAPVVAALRKATTLPLDCHLMIDDPDRWAVGYVEAGAANVTFHAEAARDVVQTARSIRSAGARAGLALKPATPLEAYEDVLTEFDMLLVMTVEPGFGGQPFMADMMPKVAKARRFLRDTGAQLWIQVDGGVSADTIEQCASAGADVFVAGSAVYSAADPAAAVTALRMKAIAATSSAASAGASGSTG